MTATRGTYARLLVDQWDFSCETSAIDVALAISEEDITSLCDTAAAYAPTLAGITIDHNGYMVAPLGIPGSIEQEMNARMGIMGVYVAALFGTDIAACPAYVLENTFGAMMSIEAPATGILTLSGSWGQGGGGGHRGLRIYDAIPTTTGNGTAVDMGAAGTNGGEAYLFVQAATGPLTNATFTVSSSATSGGTYTVHNTFTVTGVGVGAYKVSWSGATNQFMRFGITSMGGMTSTDLVCIACVRGVTQ